MSDSNTNFIPSQLNVRATASLEEEVKEDLEKEDPTPEQAEATLKEVKDSE